MLASRPTVMYTVSHIPSKKYSPFHVPSISSPPNISAPSGMEPFTASKTHAKSEALGSPISFVYGS